MKSNLLILLVLLILFGCTGKSNEEKYNDCILENMKGVSGKYAAYLVTDACRSKYPGKTKSHYEKVAEEYKRTRESKPK